MLLFKFIKFVIITFYIYVILISPFYDKNLKKDRISFYRKNSRNIGSVNNRNRNKKNNLINKQKLKENKKIIEVSYATDNKYIYPTIVSMTSLVVNAFNNTFYNIYVLHTPDFTQKSKEFLNTVEENYPDRCSIIYFNMENKYTDLSVNKKLNTPCYYRLSLPDLLPEVKRIIYLDGDTLVFEDLNELIELNMKDNVIMGFLDSQVDALNDFGFKNATVLNTGTLLMDLEGLRKYNYPKKIEDFIFKNQNRLYQEDQTIINVVMQGRIAPLPPKYGVWAWSAKWEGKKFLDNQLPHLKFNEEEFYNAMKYPAILHFISPKPFWKLYTGFYNVWWDYAKLTGFFWEIYLRSPIQKIRMR